MDAGQMTFSPGEFDDAVSIATAHHLTDDQLAAMVRSASAAVCCDRAALTTRDPQRPWSDSARTGVGSKLAP